MDREEISGISKEFDQVLEQVAAGAEAGKKDEVKAEAKTVKIENREPVWKEAPRLEELQPRHKQQETQPEESRPVHESQARPVHEPQETQAQSATEEKPVKAWRRPMEQEEQEPLPSQEPRWKKTLSQEPLPESGRIEEDVILEEAFPELDLEPELELKSEPDRYEDDEAYNRPTRGGKGTGSGLLRPSDAYIAAFFIPVIVMIVIFAQRGIFPFGSESFLRTDMYHQYAPFFSEFQHKLTTGGSLLYSWDIGMGVNFAALYAYYLASPLNWLLVLCPKSLIIEFMTYSIVLKTGLCGLTFAYYLRRHNRTSDFGICFFGVFYALSGYMAAYSWNIMWLDCILLFPLIMLGLERLVKEKKGMLYCITLGISILSNYYISIMICVFMVMYFICLLILEGKRSVKDFFVSLGQFGVYSLIAGALAAAVLLPEIFALQSTASGKINFPKDYEAYFSIFDMLARHIGNVQTETGLDHWPNIYCGVAVFMFFLLYLACKKIPVKEKAVTCGLLLMFFASFSINVLNFMWHGFHYPNSLPCRQSFIYIFLMLALCYRAYMYLDVTPERHITLAFWVSVGYILLAQKLVTDQAYHFSVFYAAILFLAIYTGLIYFYRNPKRSKAAAALLTLGVVAIEAAVNTAVTSVSTTSRTAYKADNADVKKLTEDLISENGFYRIDKVDGKTKNDGAWMNFPTVSLFSSLAHADLTTFFKRMGCEGSTNAYSIRGSTPLVDSLMSVKYSLFKGYQDLPGRTLAGNSGETYLYENPYTLPLGFMLPDGMEEEWQLTMPNPIDVQNDLCDVLDVPYVFTEAVGEEEGTSFGLTPEKPGEYYVYIMNKKVKSVSVSKNGNSRNYDNINRGYLVELGYCEAGETVTVTNKEDSESLNARAYLFEEESLKAIYEKLNRAPFILTEWNDDALSGTITAEQAGTVFFSIPYDKGWKILVDGVPMTQKRVFEAFTGVEVSEGTHTVTMTYMPEGLKPGIAVSAAAAGLLILIALGGWLLRKRNRKQKEAQEPYRRLDEEWHGFERREEEDEL